MKQETATAFHLIRLALTAAAAWLLSASISQGGTLYVKTSGDDTLSGASWALAKQTIPAAITAAAAGDQLWVASGTYTQLVTLKPGVAMYAGFNGTETSLAQRNFGINFAILDARTNGVVVTITNAGADTRVDGFIITGGYGYGKNGAGILIDVAAPTIMNNTILRNTTSGAAGAGIFINSYLIASNAYPQILGNYIYNNISLGGNGDAGAIAISGSSPLIAFNHVFGNFAGRNAGGIGCWKDCHAILVDNVIEGNGTSVESNVGLGGGIFATATDLDGNFIQNAISAPLIIDNVIAANGASSGGGIALVSANAGVAFVGNNSIVANTGSGIYWLGASPSNCNNLVAFNSAGLEQIDINAAALNNNDVFGNTVLGGKTDYVGLPDATGVHGNISVEPKLANFRIGNFHLQAGSPCIDAGLNSAVMAGFLDADLNTRVVGTAVDIGAYESTGAVLNAPTPIIYVTPAGNDGNGGLSWAAAKRTIHAGISAANPTVQQGAEVWVAQGTYPEHIVLPAFVYAYGGFAGSETTRAARNIAAHPTVIDGGGTPTIVTSQSAGYLVSTLDGFTVQNGGAFTAGASPIGHYALGGAINCTVSSPIIANNLIVSNSIGVPIGQSIQSFGSGIYCTLSAPQIIGNTFYRNEEIDNTSGAGGGIYVTYSKPTIQGNLFSQNFAKYGSAIAAYVSSVNIIGNTIQNGTYYDNGADPYAGPLDGAVFLNACYDFRIEANTVQGNVGSTGAGFDLQICRDGQVRNNLVLSNSVYKTLMTGGPGGAIFCNSIGNIQILNNTIVGNTGAGLYYGSVIAQGPTNGAVVLANNIVAFNAAGITQGLYSQAPLTLFNNCVTNPMNYGGVSPGAGDINVDPQFLNGSAGNFHLATTSPCIDAGTALYAAATDFDGVLRPLDGNNDGTAAFDIGGFEFVHPTADTDHDGMSDLAEVIAGTNPTDSNSFLKLLSHSSAGSSIALDWLSVTGRTYTIEFKPTVTGNWQTLSNNIPGTGTTIEILDSTGSSATRFYRLGVSRN